MTTDTIRHYETVALLTDRQRLVARKAASEWETKVAREKIALIDSELDRRERARFSVACFAE